MLTHTQRALWPHKHRNPWAGMLVFVDLFVLLRRPILGIDYKYDTPAIWRFFTQKRLSQSFLFVSGVSATLAPALTSSVFICNIWLSVSKPHVGGRWRPLVCTSVKFVWRFSLFPGIESWKHDSAKPSCVITKLGKASGGLMWHSDSPFCLHVLHWKIVPCPIFSVVFSRAGHVWPHLVLGAHLHGCRVHAGLPGGVRLHLQEGAVQ